MTMPVRALKALQGTNPSNKLTAFPQLLPPPGLPGQILAHSPTKAAGRTVCHNCPWDRSLLHQQAAQQRQSYSQLSKTLGRHSQKSSQSQAAQALNMPPLPLPSGRGAT